MARTFQRSPLAMAILVLLYEAPMHPYRMQQVIKERGKDRVVNVQRRASLYQTINQLERAGLIAIRETSREENRPERTTYTLTEKGHETAQEWLREALSTPAQEFPEFPAVISFMPVLKEDDVLQRLEKRAATLTEQLEDLDALHERAKQYLPRLFLLEDEITRVTLDAELQWVRGVIEDLKSGALSWSEALLRGYMTPGGDS